MRLFNSGSRSPSTDSLVSGGVQQTRSNSADSDD
jgi:hypothetical protein